jgi:hypothetical protein
MITDYSPGGILCQMPEDLLTLLKRKLDELEKTVFPNFPQGECAPGEGYKQWKIQVPKMPLLPGQYRVGEILENVLRYKELQPVINFFEQHVDSVFKFRLSTLCPEDDLRPHGNHMFPRIHIPLNETDFSFSLEDKLNDNEVKHIKIEYGNVYFINVSSSHWGKINEGSGKRNNALFSFNRFNDPELNKKFKIDEYFTDKY